MYSSVISPVNESLSKYARRTSATKKSVNIATKKLSKISLSPKQLETSTTKFNQEAVGIAAKKQKASIYSDHASPEWCW